MKIGFAYDLKVPGAPPPPGVPDDLYEEYDPPATVDAIAGAIVGVGHTVVRLGGGREFLEKLLAERVDFVFTISEGRGTFRSREGQVPAVCEMLGIPYSFSDPMTLALSLDKPFTKRLVREAGVETAPDWTVNDAAELRALAAREDLPWPLFVKPAYEGSSKGIRQSSKVPHRQALMAVAEEMLATYGQPVMVEGFVPGDEFTVGVVGNDPPRAIGAMRIRPKSGPSPDFVYSLEMKRDWENCVAYDVPPPLDDNTLSQLYGDAVKAFRAIGARDVSRVDFRIREGVPVFLEINPLPGLSPVYGDLPLLSKGMGVAYQELMRRILDACLSRQGIA